MYYKNNEIKIGIGMIGRAILHFRKLSRVVYTMAMNLPKNRVMSFIRKHNFQKFVDLNTSLSAKINRTFIQRKHPINHDFSFFWEKLCNFQNLGNIRKIVTNFMNCKKSEINYPTIMLHNIIYVMKPHFGSTNLTDKKKEFIYQNNWSNNFGTNIFILYEIF